jgi:hypothetical protein
MWRSGRRDGPRQNSSRNDVLQPCKILLSLETPGIRSLRRVFSRLLLTRLKNSDPLHRGYNLLVETGDGKTYRKDPCHRGLMGSGKETRKKGINGLRKETLCSVQDS